MSKVNLLISENRVSYEKNIFRLIAGWKETVNSLMKTMA